MNDKSNDIVLSGGNKENVVEINIRQQAIIKTKNQDNAQDASDEEDELQGYYEEFDDEEPNALNLVFPSQREIEPMSVQLDIPGYSQYIMSDNCPADSTATNCECSPTDNASQRLSPAALALWERLENITSIDEFEKVLPPENKETGTDSEQRSTRIFNGTIFH